MTSPEGTMIGTLAVLTAASVVNYGRAVNECGNTRQLVGHIEYMLAATVLFYAASVSISDTAFLTAYLVSVASGNLLCQHLGRQLKKQLEGNTTIQTAELAISEKF